MPTVFTEYDKHEFERVVVKRNGFVIGIDSMGDSVAKHHYPPATVRELEGDVTYEDSRANAGTVVAGP